MSSVHFLSFLLETCASPCVVEFSMLFSCVSGLESVSCLGISKKLSLGV